MFNRPRCRDWTALISQQLRLRNLIQISGHNIICDTKSSIYYTLHLTSMSAPFFTSEKIETPKNAIWPEINCQNILKSTAKCICIRVWQRSTTTSKIILDVSTQEASPLQQSDKKLNDIETDNIETIDKVLFLWGVYFSGLVPISKRTDVKLKDNSLIFHMHGGFFTSAECLLSEYVPQQLKSIGLIPDQIQLTKLFKNNQLQNCDHLELSNNSYNNTGNNSDSISKNNNNNNNNSSSYGGGSAYDINNHLEFPQNQNNLINNIIPDVKQKKIQFEEWDGNFLKIRYIEKKFYNSEIRPSYNVEKLLLLQEKQRKIKYKSESAKNVMDKICMKSAFCLNLELFSSNTILYRPRGNPSMGRTLNRLLFQQQEQPKPEILMKAQELRRKIETAKFRCRLLLQERNHVKHSVRRLEIKLGILDDANIEHESWLMANYRGLSREKDLDQQNVEKNLGQKELLHNIAEMIRERQRQLLRELNEIYCIEKNNTNILTIHGIPLPDAESYSDVQSPTTLSIALGYVAHTILMCSIILNVPLRNAIIYKGSASKIRDDVRDLNLQYREFPLFCRSIPPPETLSYAVFLLNQNISQFKYMLGLTKEDLRATLPNLLQLLNGTPKEHTPQNEFEQNQTIRTIGNSTISGSSSIDLNVSLPTNVNSMNSYYDKIRIDDKRVSRSVGSYTDENKIVTTNTKEHFSSEPILSCHNIKKPTIHLCNFNENGNI